MNVFRNVSLAALVIAVGSPMAGAADKDAKLAMITGPITPGVYGRLDAVKKPLPALVYAQPMFIEPPVDATGAVEPVYLHVPPEHAKNWKKYCARYDACARPVYFIKSAEYEPGYEPPKPEGPKKRKFRSGW